jgi:hypothetical protein
MSGRGEKSERALIWALVLPRTGLATQEDSDALAGLRKNAQLSSSTTT